MSLALIINPRSRRNRRHPQLAKRLAQALGASGRIFSPGSLQELDQHCRELAEAQPMVVAIHGGDGTLHRVLTALGRAYGECPLPPIAFLQGGTMNVVTSSLGLAADPESFVEELAESERDGRPLAVLQRHCLRVGDGLGFVFANGVLAHFLEEYYAVQDYGVAQALSIAGRVFLSTLVGGSYAAKVLRPFRGSVHLDGVPGPWRELTGISAGAVREVGLGFALNHRADEDPDRFCATCIFGPPLTTLLDAPAVHDGRGLSPKRAAAHLVSNLSIEAEAGPMLYTVDGDLYRHDGPLQIVLGPRLSLVRPNRSRV